MRFLGIRAEIETVDTRLMADQSVVGGRFSRSYSPYLDSLIEGCRSKHGGIFGVDLELHNVVLMIDKRVNFLPILVPVKHADGVVIRAREDVWLALVNGNVPNVISVLLDRLDLLSRIVVEDT